MTTNSPVLCACGCGHSFIPPPWAKHKRFASPECLSLFHLKESIMELAQLRQPLYTGAEGPSQTTNPTNSKETS